MECQFTSVPYAGHNFNLQVMDVFQPKRVLILTCQKFYEHLSRNLYPLSDDAPLHTLRALQTDSWDMDPVARSLEAPSTLREEPAAGE